MTQRLGRAVGLAAAIGLVLGVGGSVSAGDEKALVGSYRLTKRVAGNVTQLAGPELVGFMTFSKTYRTVIMRWSGPDGKPASIALIASYSLSKGKFCESVIYGANVDLGAPGATYDPPSQSPACTAAISDASGLAFDVPGERLRLRVARDGIIATTPRWTDHWEKVK